MREPHSIADGSFHTHLSGNLNALAMAEALINRLKNFCGEVVGDFHLVFLFFPRS